MKIVYEYSHLGGSEILQVHHPGIVEEIEKVISRVSANRSKESKEKTTKGKMLYSPIDMNKQFKDEFQKLGYKQLLDNYKIPNVNSDETISSFKQIDFVKDDILIEVQFGKYAFMFYDLAKFQYFFNENKAKVGVEIVPCHRLHKEMSKGVSYGEQLIFDIDRLKRHFPAVPVKVILIDADE